MIYRHYKGGLYYLLGYAHKLPETLANSTVEKVLTAKYEKTLEDVNIYIVHDMNFNSSYYAYDGLDKDGVYALYRNLDGQHWLRIEEDFHGTVYIPSTDEEDVEFDDFDYSVVARFLKIDGEYLFDVISELLKDTNSPKELTI